MCFHACAWAKGRVDAHIISSFQYLLELVTLGIRILFDSSFPLAQDFWVALPRSPMISWPRGIPEAGERAYKKSPFGLV